MEVARENFCQDGGTLSIEVAFDNADPQYFDLTAPVTVILYLDRLDGDIYRRNMYAADRTYKLVGSAPYGSIIFRRFENMDNSEALIERVGYLFNEQEVTLEIFKAYDGEGIIYEIRENHKSTLSIQSQDNIPDIFTYNQNIYYNVSNINCFTNKCPDGYTKITSLVDPKGYWCFPSEIIKRNLKQIEEYLNGKR
ncbi:MAG: hypothetical protein HEQ19_14005 [Gloeotrichia echinulata CP02]|jgi:hypothetical protein